MTSLREALGQMFLFGFQGYEPEKDILDLLRTLNPGGVVLFRRNLRDPEQILALTRQLQGASPNVPLFIAIDQEGGNVTRLPEPFTYFPGNRALGRSGSEDLACACAEVTSKELLAVGINFNFAPVLDVDTNPQNPIIGPRSFGPDPTEVARLGLAMLKGFRNNGVIGLGKHFPGHGDTSQDSHLTLPVVAHTLDRLQTVELEPFRLVIQDPDGPEAMMTAHVLYPSLDPEMPATLSSRILKEVLRNELGFNGVIVTDDLEMKAILDRLGPEEASLMAVKAGADQLLFCHHPSYLSRCIDFLMAAVEEGHVTETRILESVQRISILKERYVRRPLSPEDQQVLIEKIGCKEHRALAEEISLFLEDPQRAT